MTDSPLPFNQTSPIDVKYLEFDTENPRYTPDVNVSPDDDVTVITHLRERADLDELIESISTNGYIDIEPLIVMPDPNKNGFYIVLEGNRRLAAIKLLSNPSLFDKCGINPPANVFRKDSLKCVTVYCVVDRTKARAFIGFKHINGPHRWDSIAKGRYAANWYKSERSVGVTLKHIANCLGDKHDTVKRMVAGIYVLDQAQDSGTYDISDRYPGRPFAFSHLYTALTRQGFRDFLGLPDAWRNEDPQPNPIPEDFLPHLRQVFLWLYGSRTEDLRPVVTSQNPHVKMLGEVLARPKARAILMQDNDLTAAYSEVDTPDQQFERALLNAHQNAENALKKVTAYDGRDPTLYEIAEELRKTSSVIRNTMKSVIENSNDD